MTSPQDPFASPSPGDEPQRGQSPAYGQPRYGEPQFGQQQYGQQYGGPPYGSAAPQRQARNGMGVAALVFGILGLLTSWLVVGGVLGLVAVVLGVIGRGRANRGEATNGGVALAGIITGVLAVVVAVLVVVGIVALFDTADFADLAECLEEAGNDQAAIEECRQQFEEGVTGG